jgi:cardiolipin-specific phospholipase
LRPASGEYALNTILSVGSWARKPLLNRMPDLKIKIAFYYGDRDWMDPSGAKHLMNN